MAQFQNLKLSYDGVDCELISSDGMGIIDGQANISIDNSLMAVFDSSVDTADGSKSILLVPTMCLTNRKH